MINSNQAYALIVLLIDLSLSLSLYIYIYIPLKKTNILSKKFYSLITIILIVNFQTIQMKIFQYSL